MNSFKNAPTGVFELEGTSSYSPSKPLPETALARGETFEMREKRRWPERIHRTEDGQVFIPAAAFKKCLDSAAMLVKRKIKGANGQTYAQQFVSGVMIAEHMLLHRPATPKETADYPQFPHLPLMAGQVQPEHIYCSSKGDRTGKGVKVWRIYGNIPAWRGTLTATVYSQHITTDIFETYLEEAGMMVGVGRWRPENGGLNGRFVVTARKWL